MSLERYRQKRAFERTPEPEGAFASPTPRGERRFVVQRHRATRLHYDFRLEIDGVLASWAVPRGPSMRPLERRMAVRTEDHPLEYRDFEGLIPRGEYGAGDVIIWDEGTWQPETDEDPGAALRAGEVKLVLHGHRLAGRFVLVRTDRTGTDQEQWLLIHKRDQHADPDWDIDRYPTSVRSGLTNDEVRRGPTGGATAKVGPGTPNTIEDVDLSAARSEPLPGFIKPMLATLAARPFSDPAWVFELKLDGYRLQARVEGGSLRTWTRSGKDAAAWFPGFAAAPPDWLAAREAIVDGEMVALDPDGRPSFGLLQELAGVRIRPEPRRTRQAGRETDVRKPRGRLVYHAFDLLHLDGRELLGVPLVDRKELLRRVLVDHPAVRFVGHVEEHGVEFHEAVRRQGLEGSIAKRADSRYEPGRRSRSWLKIKARQEQELVVVGYEPGRGSHAELGALLVATREGSGWRFAGEVGSGLDTGSRRAWRALLDAQPLDASPADGAPDIRGARWSEPLHVIRAEFAEWTSDGLLRQAAYKGRELDRDPREVSRERPVASPRGEETQSPRRRRRPGGGSPVLQASPDELGALEAMGPEGRWEVGGHDLRLTNLDKVLFPGPGYTKRDLVRYYVTIAPVLIPYLAGRALNMHRWPDGVTGRTSFWQKQIPAHAPAWVARWDYPEAGHDQSHTYVVVDRVATLAWLANQAVIDLHPWTSRTDSYWQPSYALVDIDPGERTEWSEVLVLARLFRTALDHLGVRGYPKVTGKRGIQVWIPVVPRYTFDDTRDWVERLSRSVGAVVPDLVSWEWGKADRGGRARLDFTQNAPIKTLVAPYAVRPVPSAAVSAPIGWDELDDPALRPDGWDIRSLPVRVEERDDLFRGALDDPQELPRIG